MRRGFTLIELLVVISIIAVLAGLISVSVGIAVKTKANTKTKSLLANVMADLTNYRTVNGVYPEKDIVGPPALTWYASSHSDPAFAAETLRVTALDPDPDKAEWLQNATVLMASLNTLGANSYVTLDDAWGRVLRYRSSLYLPFLPSSTVDIDDDTPPGKDSYQLWSCGANRADDYGAVGSDDLTSWPK